MELNSGFRPHNGPPHPKQSTRTHSSTKTVRRPLVTLISLYGRTLSSPLWDRNLPAVLVALSDSHTDFRLEVEGWGESVSTHPRWIPHIPDRIGQKPVLSLSMHPLPMEKSRKQRERLVWLLKGSYDTWSMYKEFFGGQKTIRINFFIPIVSHSDMSDVFTAERFTFEKQNN